MSPPGPRRGRYWVPYFVLAIALGLTAIATWFVSRSTTARDRARFESLSQATQISIERRLETYVNLLRASAAVFAANDGTLDHEEFRDYVAMLDVQHRYPGIQGIGFTRRLPTSELAALTEAMRARGIDWFHVWPEPQGPEFHAIVQLEPLDRRNRAALGYDMHSDPVRAAAMARARDTGAPAASPRVVLVQEIELRKQSGFLIYVPVYRGGMLPQTVAERRERLSGFVYSPFRTADLLRGIFGPNRNPGVTFAIYDGRAPDESELLYAATNARGGPPPRLTMTRQTLIAGRPWTISFQSTPAFEATSDRRRIPGALFGGLLASTILFAVTRAQSQARADAERNAAELEASAVLLRERESRVRSLVEANIIGITISESTGAVVEANDAFLELIGYTRDELHAGRIRTHEITPPEYREKDHNAVEEMLRTGRHAPYEKEYLRRDGTRLPVLLGRALLSEETNRAVGFVLDLTERKTTEKQLRDQTQILATINRVGQLLSAELDLQKVVQGVTDAATDLVGAENGAFFYNVIGPEGEAYTLYALSGMSRDVFSGLPMPRRTELFGPAFRGESVIRIDDVGTDSRAGKNPPFNGLPPGHPPVRSFLAAPVISRSGEVLGALFFGHRDPRRFHLREEQIVRGLAAQAAVAVDNARLYETAMRDRQRAEDANRAKDDFLATLSHELRTPMTAILGWSRLVQIGGMAGDEVRTAIEAIARSARAQAQLIDDLLDVSRITTGKLRMERKRTDMAAVFANATDAIRPMAEAKSLTFRVDLPSAALPVRGDAHRLQQIVGNLLTNAVKFTPAGGRIDAILRREEHQAHIAIRDTGQGIDPTFLPFVFERFRQADSTATRQHGGLGIGLSIVRYLVQMHGGTASASSEGSGKGSTFEVRIPLDTEPEDSIADAQPKVAASLVGTRVLVVEDEEEVRSFVEATIGGSGGVHRGAASAAEALEFLEREPFDAIVSDIAMPEMDGIALIRQIRESANPALRNLAAVALTAYGRTEDSDRILDAGFDAYLHKPVDPANLVQTLCDTMGNVKAERS
jgi:PAS domain S-box-containing protein